MSDRMRFTALGIAIILNAAAHLMLKWGRISGVKVSPLFIFGPLRIDWPFLMGGFFFFCSLVFYYVALTRIQLSVAYPLLMGSGLLLIVTASLVFFGERLTVVQIFGIFLITVGIWCIR